MKLLLSLCLCIGVFKGIWCDLSTDSVITIPGVGQVRGAQKTTVSGKTFQAYRGIPFGKSPTGELRFRDPVPADPWVGEVLDATQEGPTCVQYHALLRIPMGTEDCLKLNVYTPGLDNTNNSLPVMVWIHGGSWFMGSGNGEIDIYGPRRFLDRDIVLVTINYRLGPLGFLSTEDAEAPGNYGLLDQLLALKWVRENIRSFGGNPDLVTIFGQSAGGASVNHHIVSPLSKGLFHRAITQSGSSLNSWALENDKSVATYTKLLAEDLGCPTSVSSELMTCLRTKPVRDMVLFRKKIEVLGVIPIAFGPRIDIERESPFIPADPKALMEQKKINSVPTITGLTANEGALFIAVLLSRNGVLMKNFSENPIKLLRYVVSDESALKNDDLVLQAVTRYLTLEKPFDEQIKQMEHLISDYIFFQGIDEAAQLLSKVNDQPTYYYYYNHHGQMSFPTILGVPSDKNLGVSHTDEIYLMFSNELFSTIPTTPDDEKVSNILLDLWTTFAKDGVPRSDLVPGGWAPLTETQKRYLRIDAEDPSTVNGPMPFSERIRLLI